MFKKIRKQEGFTLVEMLVSMAIFMTFTGILISSYTGIIRAQRDANFYRDMYVQARQVMETLVQELRDGMVDYGHASVTNVVAGNVLSVPLPDGQLYLVSRDGATKTHITYEKNDPKDAHENVIKLQETHLKANNPPSNDIGDYDTPFTINLNDPTNVKVSKFKLYFSPKIDPYDLKTVDYSTSQFQPRVTVYAEFTKELGANRKPYVMDLQTTVSSRVFNQVYATDYQYTNLGKY